MGYGPHPLRFDRRRLAIACAFFLALLALFVLLRRLRLNTTESAPIGLYFILPRSFSANPIGTDTWVAVCLPQQLARFSRRRGYLSSGSCPPGVAPVLKHLAARPGDRIDLSPTGLSVNGHRIPWTTPRTRDSKGRPLPRPPFGSLRVGQDELWLISPISRSWDSRYFGPVGTEGLLGVAVPIWIAGPPGGVEAAEPVAEEVP
jgi:conjugative transfer signal peptidase TraF